jgi:hypothetical protein
VVSQQPRSGPGPHGNFVAGYEVMIRTEAGHTGTLFVPADQYGPEKVKPLLAALAARLDAVGSLTDKS